jgi:ATP-dependent Clp protease, protease subunit
VTADLIVSQLLLLDAHDSSKDIKLFINSPGGSISDGKLSFSSGVPALFTVDLG